MDKPIRISRRWLEEQARQICERDRAILQSLQKCRYLTTDQITTLHFTSSATPSAALRAASRSLSKLKDYGLIGALKRRIGGVRAGSGGFVWHMTGNGLKLLDILAAADADITNAPLRKRSFEPSTRFLAHTLSVAEALVQLTVMGRGEAVELVSAALEPECWRECKANNKPAILKPDLFAVTAAGEYEDSWFLEIDLATEAPIKILEKCHRYLIYYRSGIEQRQRGVFPYVVWIVPDNKRKDTLRQHIQDTFAKQPDIFLVITPNELEPLVLHGPDQIRSSNAKGQEGAAHD